MKPVLGSEKAKIWQEQEGNNPENQILAYKTRLRATAAPGCSAAPGGAQMEGGGAEGCSPARSQRGGGKQLFQQVNGIASRGLFCSSRVDQIALVPGPAHLVRSPSISDARVSACKHAPPTLPSSTY